MGNGHRVITAKRLIIRYIEAEKLRTGDKLPSHDFFRKRFGYGMTTISSAFESLRLDGMLSIRDKVGVYLQTSHPDSYYSYVVGVLVSNWIHGTPYYAQLLNAVQLSLVRLGCQVRFFFARPPKQHTQHLPLSEVGGLKNKLHKKELDALIHLDHLAPEDHRFLQQFNLPLLYIGMEQEEDLTHNAYFLFDSRKMIREICRQLMQTDTRRPLLQLAPGLAYLAEVFQQATSGRGQSIICTSLYDTDRITEHILNTSAASRPDHLVFLDDLAALRMLCNLTRQLPREQMPSVSIVENRQLYLSYPITNPMLYEIDLESIATKATEYLFTNLKKDSIVFPSCHHPLPCLQGQQPTRRR